MEDQLKKVSSKDIVKNLKEREKKEQRTNITFRLNEAMINKFRSKCLREKVSMASVIELLVQGFIEN